MTSDGPYAKVICDSISPDGHRLTTFEVRFHRFVLSEFNTHCVLERNSASSRAIPLAKQITRVRTEPATPHEWREEQRGMQGGELMDTSQVVAATNAWLTAREDAVQAAMRLGEIGVHKSIANRLLEPFMWHTVCVTATAWSNFFNLRCSPLAQPEIRVAAELMKAEYDASTPMALQEDDWHLPYVWDDAELVDWLDDHKWDDAYADRRVDDYGAWDPLAASISSARVARASYMTQDGRRDPVEDLTLYERLTSADPMHASPLGQVARVDSWNQITHEVPLQDGSVFNLTVPKVGKLIGYRTLRHDVEMQKGYQSFS